MVKPRQRQFNKEENKMKNILLTLTITGFLVGCGGGGGSTPSSDNGEDSTSQQANAQNNESSFEYPYGFGSFDTAYYSLTSTPVNEINIRTTLPSYIGLVSGEGLAALKVPPHRRSHCDQGSLGEMNLQGDLDSSSPTFLSSSGSFNFDASTGIELIDRETCVYAHFYHGYISYDVKHDSEASTESYEATLGDPNGPFLISLSDGSLVGADGYNGSFSVNYTSDTSEWTSPYIEHFNVKTDLSSPYTIGLYTKKNHVVFKNYHRKEVKSGENSEHTTANYEAYFTYKGHDFKLYYSGETTRYDNSINNGSVTLELQAVNRPEKIVTMKINTQTGITYTKEGGMPQHYEMTLGAWDLTLP